MNLAQVIEWKYGLVADCDLTKGVITRWYHPTVPKPTPEQLILDTAEYESAEKTPNSNNAIKAQIAALDQKRIRPMAEGDSVYLAKLNEQIKALRAQLK